MELDKLIEEYKEISYKIFLADDFGIKKNILTKIMQLLKKFARDIKKKNFLKNCFYQLTL